jgi:hypothetical protein
MNLLKSLRQDRLAIRLKKSIYFNFKTNSPFRRTRVKMIKLLILANLFDPTQPESLVLH